jgi:eukaryotic-like serine/threonine-protein kinase
MSNVFPPGLQLGQRYRVVRLIQSGALSAVYEAEELETHQRAVLKWLRFSGPEHGQAMTRVLARALAAKQLLHPHIARSLEVVREGSSLFLVTELLAGDALQASLSPHLMPRRERIRLLVQALRGVAAAHALGVTHGGLHPGNIFLANVPGESTATAKVLDFATSQLCVAEHAALGLMQRGNATTLGPHVYMSPEQITQSHPVDLRSDVYSLAVLVYQALTGRLPYTADNAIELAVKFATSVALPAAALCPELPSSLDRLLSSALARNPEARLDTLLPLIAELEAFQPFSSLAEQPLLRGAETALMIQRRPANVPPRIAPQLARAIGEPAPEPTPLPAHARSDLRPRAQPQATTHAAPALSQAASATVITAAPAKARPRSYRVLGALAAALVAAVVLFAGLASRDGRRSVRPPALPRIAAPRIQPPQESHVRALTATLSSEPAGAEPAPESPGEAASHDAAAELALPSEWRSERRRLRAERRAHATPASDESAYEPQPFRAGPPPRKEEF